MDDSVDHRLTGSNPIRRTTTNNSHVSVAPSTKSWVTYNQLHPPGPPPDLPSTPPSPVDTVRPLPNPFGHRGPLRAVNASGPSGDESTDVEVPRVPTHLGAGPHSRTYGSRIPLRDVQPLNPIKKKTFVGGFVKGIRRLPKAMFGYGYNASGSETNARRQGTLAMGTEATTSTAPNTLAATHVPAPAIHPHGPATYFPRHMHPRSNSPLPEVVRIGDHRDNRPTFMLSPPSPDLANGERAEVYQPLSPPDFDDPLPDSVPSTVNRTTVMLYNDDTVAHDPYAIARRPSNDPRQSVAPTGHIHGAIVPELPSHQSNLGPRVTYASQAPPRRPLPLPSLPQPLPLTQPPPLPQPPPHGHLQTIVPQNSPNFVNHDMEPAYKQEPEESQSPVVIHPQPTDDYRKMALSPQPTSRRTWTTFTSYFEPSFISELHPVESFFKLLYNLPWIARERVTIDYLPGEVKSKKKRKYNKPMRSWYQAVLSASRRNSANVDLLSSGTSSQRTSHGTGSQGTGQPSLLSPMSHDSDRRRRPSTSHHHEAHRHHSHSHRHHRRREGSSSSSHRRHRRHEKDYANGSPAIAAVYPYPYPGYGYPYPMPAPVMPPLPAPNSEISTEGKPGQHGLNREAIPRALQPGYGFSPYQPFMTPPMYVIQSASPASHSTPPKSSDAAENGHPKPLAQTKGPAPTAIPGSFSPEVSV